MKDISIDNVEFADTSVFKITNGKVVANGKPSSMVRKLKFLKRTLVNGSVGDYCLKCKSSTENKSLSYKHTNNNRTIRSSNCVVCGTVKTTFVANSETTNCK